MEKIIIVDKLKHIEKPHGVSLNQWVGGIIKITVQKHYNLQYLTMRLSGYINAPTEPSFLSLRHGMEYLMCHSHETKMYSRKKFPN